MVVELVTVKSAPICTVPVKPFRVTVATLAGVFVSAPLGVGEEASNRASSVPSGYPLLPSSVPLTKTQFPDTCQSVPLLLFHRKIAWAKAVVEQSIQQRASSSVERVVFRRIDYGDVVLLFVKLFYFWYYAFGITLLAFCAAGFGLVCRLCLCFYAFARCNGQR